MSILDPKPVSTTALDGEVKARLDNQDSATAIKVAAKAAAISLILGGN